MKRWRVMVTAGVLAVLLVAFFLVPLPVGRIRSEALVEFQPDATRKVFPRASGILVKLEDKVVDGAEVVEGQTLAWFSDPELESQFKEAHNEFLSRYKQVEYLEAQLRELPDGPDAAKIRQEKSFLESERESYRAERDGLKLKRDDLVLRAPVSGVLINPPTKDALGRYWDKDQKVPFCSIGDPTRLRALVPISPDDYELLKTDREYFQSQGPDADIKVTIRVQGHGGSTWQGKIESLPLSEVKDLPIQLSTRGGGSVAIKPGSPEGQNIPQNQLYLISVKFVDPDRSVYPGTMGQVKVHCRWHSGAWWVWRTVNNLFDLGLM